MLADFIFILKDSFRELTIPQIRAYIADKSFGKILVCREAEDVWPFDRKNSDPPRLGLFSSIEGEDETDIDRCPSVVESETPARIDEYPYHQATLKRICEFTD